MRRAYLTIALIAATVLTVGVNSTYASDYLEDYIRLFDASGAQSLVLKAPSSLGTEVTLTLPTAVGADGQALITNASGIMSWDTVAVDLQTAFDGGTSIALGGDNYILDADSTGDIYFQDGGVNRLAILDDGTLTLTAGATSTWSTSAGNLTLDTPAALYLGSSGTDAITFTTDGTGDGEVVLPTDSISSTEILNNTITGADIADDNLDYTDFIDAMTVDAATTVALGANSLTYNVSGAANFVINASSTGDILFQDGGVNRLQILDDGTLTLTGGAASTWSTAAGNLTVDSAATLNLGTTAATAISMGKSGVTTTNIGTLQVGQNGTDGSFVIFSEQGVTDYGVTFNPNAAMTQGVTYTLPPDDGTPGQVLTSDGSGALTWTFANGVTPRLDQIIAATATNTIDSTNYAQTWNWSTASTQTPFTWSANALTSGKLLSLNSSSTGLTGNLLDLQATGNNAGVTGNVLNINVSGASAAGVPLYLTNNGTGVSFRVDDVTSDTTPLIVDASGNMAVGATSALAKVDIAPATADALRIRPYSTSAGNTGQLEFLELAANGTDYVGLKAPDAITTSTIWTLPNVEGSANQVMKTDGAGTLSWADATDLSGVYSVYKTTQESVVSNVTLQNDDEILFAVGANEEWTGTMAVIVNSSAQADFKMAITAPTGSTCNFSYSLMSTPSSGTQSNLGCGVSSSVVPMTGVDELIIINFSVKTVGTSGNVNWQWAQGVSKIDITYVRPGSNMQAYKSN